MADWHEELEILLSQLRVGLGETPPDEPSLAARGPTLSEPLSVEVRLPLELETLSPDVFAPDENPADGVEVSAVRSEIEATLGRVLALARAGRMESTLRDDVIFILKALTRRLPDTITGATSDARAARDEWQLASAAAVLRFCRIVLHITNALEADEEP
ncbi:MAG TPA: hypothetical protein VFU88_13920 [Ktedonobacterales bacterium]|nr:hypothetical protein [Ktedonobacterales bacterium]